MNSSERASGENGPTGETIGLRERKKRQARIQTHRAALELVQEHGLAHVTVEMIAERAGISQRTFFNHWATKESAVLGLVYEDIDALGNALRARPADEDPRLSLRGVMREWMARIPADAEVRDLKRCVMAAEPSLHAVSAGRMAHAQDDLIAALSERLDGEDVHDRAVLTVQLAFALTRAAFFLGLEQGIPLEEEFDRVLAHYDAHDMII